jgi:hypothetical protein
VIRDGNGTRSLETLMRYRGAALADFMRCLNPLQALPAEPRAEALAAPPRRRRGRPIVPANGRASQRPAAQAPRRRPSRPPGTTGPVHRSDLPSRRPPGAPLLAAISPALAALCAATKRTRESVLKQGVGSPATPHLR